MVLNEKEYGEGDINLLETEVADLEDVDDNLQFEAERMLQSWNRERLLEEADEERERILDESKNEIGHYDGETPFADLIQEMDRLPGKQVYINIIEPNPEGKKIMEHNTILFDRTGFLEFNQIPFESSAVDGKPSIMNLGVGPIIPGLLRALLEMREGERANVVIKPSMAYGKTGSPPVIPPNSLLYYNLKVYKVWEESELEVIEEYERKRGIVVSLCDRVECIRKQMVAAKQFLADDFPREALVRYKAALTSLEQEPEDTISQSSELSRLRSVLCQNISIILNKLKNYKSASNAAKRALLSDRNNIKAYYQLVKARMELSDFDGASKYLQRAFALAPNNQELKDLQCVLNFKSHDEKMRRDEIMMKMSRGIVGATPGQKATS